MNDEIRKPEFEFLTTLSVRLEPPLHLGETPTGSRKTVYVSSGEMAGPRLSGEVLPGGGDWAYTTRDGVLHLDVRLTLRAENGAMIHVAYTGVRHGPDDVMQALARGETVPPNEMYFRIQPRFETGDSRFQWLNKILAVGIGERLAEGPRYYIYELL